MVKKRGGFQVSPQKKKNYPCFRYKDSLRSIGQSPIYIFLILSVLQLLVLSVQYWLTSELWKSVRTGQDV